MRTPVVGIGASAGGLEALREFFGGCEGQTNMAFVVVQHLDPTHSSLMAQLLERHTGMPVRQVAGGEELEADNIYVIPPGRGLAVQDNRLQLTEFTEQRGMRRPIDDFLESLADDCGDRAASVILSGTGGDGTRGLRAIKEHGGICIAQEPDSARYDGMPVSAINTGLIDFISEPGQIIPILRNYFDRIDDRSGPVDQASKIDAHLDGLCKHLLEAVGHDFSGYKRATLIRRVARRMHVLGIDNPADYIARTRADPEECNALFRDLLINVTRFFRDAEQFTALHGLAIETIIGQAAKAAEIRVWVPGCSSGEEVYTIAMLFADAMDRADKNLYVQIFGTDIDDRMLEAARGAIYPLSAIDDIPESFRDRFVVNVPGGFQVSARIRDMTRFSPHNLISDPPFAKMDLVSCRNLLIYLNEDLQSQVLPLFHFSLVERGWLFLGSSESIGRHDDLFETVDQRARLFQRKSVKGRYQLQIGVPSMLDRRKTSARAQVKFEPGESLEVLALQRIAQAYAPVSLLVDTDGMLLDRWGTAGKFLDFPDQLARSIHVPSLARPGLREVLGPLLRSVQETGRRSIASAVSVRTPFGMVEVTLACEKVDANALLIVIRDNGPLQPFENGESFDEFSAEDGQARFLEEELQTTRHRLRTTVEELETTNEELKSSNEEMMSMNEELQSTNEELTTVNDELKSKVDQLLVANSDLKNFFESTESIVLVVDKGLILRSFTEAATDLFRLDRQHLGRHLSELSNDLADDKFVRLAEQAARQGKGAEYRTSSRDGERDYITRIIPYRLLDGNVEGATLVFTDVTKAMVLERDLREERERLRLALQVAKVGIWEYEPSTDRTRLDATEKELLDIASDEEGESMEPILARLPIEDRDRINQALRQAMDGEHEFDEIFRLPLRSGGTRWLHGMGKRIDGDENRKFIGVTFDITPEREVLETRDLMIREMNHRVKNLFAIISALIALSARSAENVDQLASDLKSRIHSLGQSHALTADRPFDSLVSLEDVIRTVVAPSLRDQSFTCSGPDVSVPANQLTSLALILHEWATNAAKYGALAIADGKLEVVWEADEGEVRLSWTETGRNGKGQEQAGFGTRLIDASARQLNGTAKGEASDTGYARSLHYRGSGRAGR